MIYCSFVILKCYVRILWVDVTKSSWQILVTIVEFTKVVKKFDHRNLKLYGKFANAILPLSLYYNTKTNTKTYSNTCLSQ